MLKFNFPTNWDDALIDGLDPQFVDCLYGQAKWGEYGGGRSSMVLPAAGGDAVRRHIEKARKKGIGFNYLFNSTCHEYAIMDSDFYKRLRGFVDRLQEYGITGLTVFDMHLAGFFRKYYPGLKIATSLFTHVATVNQARRFEDQGVAEILLSNPNNFALIRAIRSAVSCKLTLFANLHCLIFCHEDITHSYSGSHSSQSLHRSGGFYFDHHIMRCSANKVSDPELMLKTMYVRPEDIQLYESLGVDKLKFVERMSFTSHLLALHECYKNRTYEGDFLDIVNVLGFVNRRNNSAPDLSYVMRPGKINFLKLFWRALNIRPFDIRIDNSKLNGMKREIMEKEVACDRLNCERCGVCRKYFRQAAKYEENDRKATADSLRRMLDSIASGGVFSWWP